MIALTFHYEGTVNHRMATCGGMDSEYSHSTVEKKTLTVVVQRDEPYFIEQARAYVMRYGGNAMDPAWKGIESMDRLHVAAILHTTTRLD